MGMLQKSRSANQHNDGHTMIFLSNLAGCQKHRIHARGEIHSLPLPANQQSLFSTSSGSFVCPRNDWNYITRGSRPCTLTSSRQLPLSLLPLFRPQHHRHHHHLNPAQSPFGLPSLSRTLSANYFSRIPMTDCISNRELFTIPQNTRPGS